MEQRNETIEIQASRFEGAVDGVTEFHLLISVARAGLSFEQQLEQIQATYRHWLEREEADGVQALFKRYFLSDAANQFRQVEQSEDGACPYSVVQQAPSNGTKVALWCYLQRGMYIGTDHNGWLTASHNGYRHHWCAGLHAKANNSEFQTRLLLEEYVTLLHSHQCTLKDNCLRTWLFVQNVDVNYAGVVKARRELFMTQGLTKETHYIASTGIEGRHADPAVYVQMDGYAVEGLQPKQVRYLYAPAYLNPTYEYGVTFERGTAVTYGDRKHLFISGTASIDNRGEILFPGHIEQQARRMMENIQALLEEADATIGHIVQAITYLRDPADYTAVKGFFARHYPQLPLLIVQAPVCRPGWLIETECMAIVPWKEASFPAY